MSVIESFLSTNCFQQSHSGLLIMSLINISLFFHFETLLCTYSTDMTSNLARIPSWVNPNKIHMFEREIAGHEKSWSDKKRKGDGITMLIKIKKNNLKVCLEV